MNHYGVHFVKIPNAGIAPVDKEPVKVLQFYPQGRQPLLFEICLFNLYPVLLVSCSGSKVNINYQGGKEDEESFSCSLEIA